MRIKSSCLRVFCPDIRPGIQQDLDALDTTLVGSHVQWCRAFDLPRVPVDPQLQQPLEALDMAILGSNVDRPKT